MGNEEYEVPNVNLFGREIHTTTSSTTIANERAHQSGISGWVQRHQLLAAYGITFLLAWGPMFAMLAGLRGRLPSPLVLVFALLVGWAPAVGAIIVSAITGGRAEVGRLLGRFLIWRVGFHWYLVAFFLMALIILGRIGLHVLFGGEMPFLPFTASTSVGGVVSTFIGMMVFGLLPKRKQRESVGWLRAITPCRTGTSDDGGGHDIGSITVTSNWNKPSFREHLEIMDNFDILISDCQPDLSLSDGKYALSPTILQTKLFIPIPSPGHIHRQALLDRLNAGFQTKSTIVVAPPGFGKTSIISEWIRQTGIPAGWLSLDEGDNAPDRFFAHFIASLECIESSLGAQLLPGLHSSPSLNINSLLTNLINEIAGLPGRFLLVLDDFHLIENPEILQGITFLLEHLPSQLHLVIATRSDPPLPLVKLRTKGAINELRIADLRFRSEEVNAFFQAAVGDTISPEEIAALESRTEGWIAGLQLAVLSMKQHPAQSRFIQEFTGNNRYVLDYLVEEVLRHQPDSVRQFLLSTSVLDRFCSDLCDAVLGFDSQEAGVPYENGDTRLGSQAILERLELSNLFLIPLDNQRRWYRYHHLFADFLRHLLQVGQKSQIPQIHRRASQWFHAQGLLDEAVKHALAAQDWQLAAEQISQNSRSLILHGEFTKLIHWVEQIPPDYRQSDRVLLTFYAWALIFSGRVAAVEPIILILEQDAPEYQGRRNQANELILRAYLITEHSRHKEAIQMTEVALRQLDPADHNPDVQTLIAVAMINLADNYRFLGDFHQAESVYRKAIPINRQVGNLSGVMGCYRNWGDILMERAQLSRAVEIYQEGIEQSRAWAEQEFGEALNLLPSATLFMRLGEIRYEQNDVDQAVKEIDTAVHLMELSGSTHLVRACYLQAKAALARHDLVTVSSCMKKLREFAAGITFPYIIDQVEWLLTDLRLRLARLNLPADHAFGHARLAVEIEEWLNADIPVSTDQVPYLYEPRFMVLARCFLSTGQPGEAVRLLIPLLHAAQSSSRKRDVLERLILLAEAGHMLGDQEAALTALSEALGIGEAHGFTRLFLDEGETLRPLLLQALHRNMTPGYTASLLKSVTGPDKESEIPQSANLFLVEPLSERELEVLGLMAEGLSNQQIAEQLVVALSTVKKHASAILGKLSASNRTEAVRHARTLGLI